MPLSAAEPGVSPYALANDYNRLAGWLSGVMSRLLHHDPRPAVFNENPGLRNWLERRRELERGWEEKRAERLKGLRAQALSKLTPDEMKALGVREDQ